MPVSFFDFTYSNTAGALAIWMKDPVFLGWDDLVRENTRVRTCRVRRPFKCCNFKPEFQRQDHETKWGPTRIMEHYYDVILRNMDVCISLCSLRLDRGGTDRITALDALCAIANGGFEACERVLWKGCRGLFIGNMFQIICR